MSRIGVGKSSLPAIFGILQHLMAHFGKCCPPFIHLAKLAATGCEHTIQHSRGPHFDASPRDLRSRLVLPLVVMRQREMDAIEERHWFVRTKAHCPLKRIDCLFEPTKEDARSTQDKITNRKVWRQVDGFLGCHY